MAEGYWVGVRPAETLGEANEGLGEHERARVRPGPHGELVDVAAWYRGEATALVAADAFGTGDPEGVR